MGAVDILKLHEIAVLMVYKLTLVVFCLGSTSPGANSLRLFYYFLIEELCMYVSHYNEGTVLLR